MNFGYSKQEKLKSKKVIEQLFAQGKAVTEFPLRLVYLKTDFDDGQLLKTAVSVSKKLHKKAVNRNRIKRLMREAYRLNKPKYFNKNETAYAFMILYISKDKATFNLLDSKIKVLFEKFLKQTTKDETLSE
jgi:ribonuclease P protein component